MVYTICHREVKYAKKEVCIDHIDTCDKNLLVI